MHSYINYYSAQLYKGEYDLDERQGCDVLKVIALTRQCSLGKPVESQHCNPDVKITYVNGKQISDDEFFHTVNVSFALVIDSGKAFIQILSGCPDREHSKQFLHFLPLISE